MKIFLLLIISQTICFAELPNTKEGEKTDVKIQKKDGVTVSPASPLEKLVDIQARVSTAKYLASEYGVRVDWDLYTLAQLQNKVTETEALRKRGIIQWDKLQAVKAAQVTEERRRVAAEARLQEQREASARGLTVLQYREQRMAALNAQQAEIYKEQQEVFKLWLLERQVNALEFSAESQSRMAESVDFQNFLLQYQANRRR